MLFSVQMPVHTGTGTFPPFPIPCNNGTRRVCLPFTTQYRTYYRSRRSASLPSMYHAATALSVSALDV